MLGMPGDGGQDAAVEVAEDLKEHVELPQPPQKVQLPAFLTSFQVCDVELRVQICPKHHTVTAMLDNEYQMFALKPVFGFCQTC